MFRLNLNGSLLHSCPVLDPLVYEDAVPQEDLLLQRWK